MEIPTRLRQTFCTLLLCLQALNLHGRAVQVSRSYLEIHLVLVAVFVLNQSGVNWCMGMESIFIVAMCHKPDA